MPTPTLVNSFLLDLGLAKHNFSSDAFKLALTNTAINLETHAVLADLTEVAYTFLADRSVTIASWTRAADIAKAVISDKSLIPSGGSVGPFQYVYLYNDTNVNKPLIWAADLGTPITINDGQKYDLDFDDTNGSFQLRLAV